MIISNTTRGAAVVRRKKVNLDYNPSKRESDEHAKQRAVCYRGFSGRKRNDLAASASLRKPAIFISLYQIETIWTSYLQYLSRHRSCVEI
ncbi:hypothetical protein IOC57_08070 [Bacillus sp. SD075]|uniref:hypothetical protein n=1 Tax=Bacillus sp. SD075 TaxID=2781732 RepID=UPI001A95E592|nr:hypothetical protein [Bacillus sp. SD075]MBO0997701.1 hypothetical protein [Bacillus sp. SD075]